MIGKSQYTQSEVLEILGLLTDSPEEILKKWTNDISLIPINESNYTGLIWEFPVILDDREVGRITIFDYNDNIEELLIKYYGKDYPETWTLFSHDSYQYCCFLIDGEFDLPQLDEDFYLLESTFLDKSGNTFEYRIITGRPSTEEISKKYNEYIHPNGWSHFYSLSTDFSVYIKSGKISGDIMGQEINKSINKRLLDYDF
jgi:hypothetical protein